MIATAVFTDAPTLSQRVHRFLSLLGGVLPRATDSISVPPDDPRHRPSITIPSCDSLSTVTLENRDPPQETHLVLVNQQ
jgi:hypothetical protein